jgi:hypothetical protein
MPEMIHSVQQFLQLSMYLKGIEITLRQSEKQGNFNEIIPDDLKEMFKKNLDEMASLCNEMGFDFTNLLIDSIKGDLELSHYTGLDFSRALKELFRRVDHESFSIRFVVVPKSKADHYGQIDLFGSQVSANFHTSVYDIEEAGSCYALGRHTACVFHLMRVLEKGLHALARELKITFPTPLELENWQNIIDKIESEIRDLNKLPKGQQKSDDLKFYSEAAKEFRYFKDAWRNHVSHSREKYDEREAKRILEHVRDFMEHIAVKIKE